MRAPTTIAYLKLALLSITSILDIPVLFRHDSFASLRGVCPELEAQTVALSSIDTSKTPREHSMIIRTLTPKDAQHMRRRPVNTSMDERIFERHPLVQMLRHQ